VYQRRRSRLIPDPRGTSRLAAVSQLLQQAAPQGLILALPVFAALLARHTFIQLSAWHRARSLRRAGIVVRQMGGRLNQE
jgi:hypothetical protein